MLPKCQHPLMKVYGVEAINLMNFSLACFYLFHGLLKNAFFCHRHNKILTTHFLYKMKTGQSSNWADQLKQVICEDKQ